MFKDNKLFFKNFSIYFLGLITSGVISFLTIPLIIRIYGVEVYGEFSLVQNAILILISFSGGWLNQCILRFNDYSHQFKMIIFLLYYIILLPTIILCFGLVYFMQENFFNGIVGVVTMFFGSFSALMITFNQSKFNAGKTFFVDFVRVLSFVIPILVLGYFMELGRNYSLILYCFCFSYFLSFLVLVARDKPFFIFSVKRIINILRDKKYLDFVVQNKKFISYGWPLAMWFTIASILNVSDRYIIDYYLTKKDLGVYSSIYDLIYKGVTLMFVPVLSSGYPILTKKYNAGFKKEAFVFLKKMILLEMGMFLVMILVGFLLKDFFIEKIIGIPATTTTTGMVIPILIGAFIWQLAMLVHKPLEFALQTKTMLFFVLFSLFINVTLNIVFIPQYGVIFAAYSTIISSILYLGLSLFRILKHKE